VSIIQVCALHSHQLPSSDRSLGGTATGPILAAPAVVDQVLRTCNALTSLPSAAGGSRSSTSTNLRGRDPDHQRIVGHIVRHDGACSE